MDRRNFYLYEKLFKFIKHPTKIINWSHIPCILVSDLNEVIIEIDNARKHRRTVTRKHSFVRSPFINDKSV